MLFQAGGFSFCSKWMPAKTAQTTPKYLKEKACQKDVLSNMAGIAQ